MSPARQHNGLAARMGRWSAAHWKTAVFGWLGLVLLAFALASMVGTKSVDPNATGPGQSGRMDRILDEGFKQPAGESVLVQNRSVRAGDPAFKAAFDDVVARVSKVPAVVHLHRGPIAHNGHAALVAAGIPLLLALTAVFATFGLIALPSHLVPMANEAPAMVLLIGLAVGVDYSLFYLKREREERAAGRSTEAAVAAAAATSGRSVLISGLTVITAMAGMFLTGDQTFASLAVATILVVAVAVAVAVLGSLTVLPALLSQLGDKVDRLHVPLFGRLRRNTEEGEIWAGSSTASCAGRHCRRRSPRDCCWRSPHRPCSCTSPLRERSRSRSRSR